MASEWIKMRSGLLTNPKVIRMARLLAQNRHFMEWWTRGTRTQCDVTVYELCDVTVVTRVTVGSLLSLWASVNECATGDGFVKGITLFEIDEMAGVPGFGDAMAAVGWVEEGHDGILFPNFHEHNTVGKERSTGAKTGSQRTKEWRERKAQSPVTGDAVSDVTVTSHVDHREEKRREEEKPKAAHRELDTVALGVVPDAPPEEFQSTLTPEQKAAVPLVIALRELGVTITASNPLGAEWAAKGLTPTNASEAVDFARIRGKTGPIHPNYLNTLIDDVLHPKAARESEHAWKRTDQGIERKAGELGIYARPGELYPALRERCESELRKREQGIAA